MAAITSWHRCGTKLRLCHPMCTCASLRTVGVDLTNPYQAVPSATSNRTIECVAPRTARPKRTLAASVPASGESLYARRYGDGRTLDRCFSLSAMAAAGVTGSERVKTSCDEGTKHGARGIRGHRGLIDGWMNEVSVSDVTGETMMDAAGDRETRMTAHQNTGFRDPHSTAPPAPA